MLLCWRGGVVVVDREWGDTISMAVEPDRQRIFYSCGRG